MIKIDPKFLFADLFCGAGGFTTGAEQSGFARGALAINHWRPAVSTHRQKQISELTGELERCRALRHKLLMKLKTMKEDASGGR